MEENIIVKLLNDKDLGTSRLLTREEEQEIFSLYAKDKSLREDVQTIMINANVASLDETVDDDREISAIEKIKDSNSTPQEFVLEDEKRHLINDAMERLSPREQEIIKYRYNSEDGVLHSFAEVAEKLGISRQRVQKIEQKAIKEMKEYIKNCEK